MLLEQVSKMSREQELLQYATIYWCLLLYNLVFRAHFVHVLYCTVSCSGHILFTSCTKTILCSRNILFMSCTVQSFVQRTFCSCLVLCSLEHILLRWLCAVSAVRSKKKELINSRALSPLSTEIGSWWSDPIVCLCHRPFRIIPLRHLCLVYIKYIQSSRWPPFKKNVKNTMGRQIDEWGTPSRHIDIFF